ncbi:hypothetical protein C8R47DRAFT_1066101 [Mycena vitilis]|nr:hypothetical protein C8R47DRAFT_1066101 [Mycena vitilis]
MSASILETTLISGGHPLIDAIFRRWDPATIFLLGRANYRLRALVHCYVLSSWKVSTFIGLWFNDTTTFQRLLTIAPAILCGPAVLQFFDRSASNATPLEICVEFDGFVSIGKFLVSQGYCYRPRGRRSPKDFNFLALFEATRFPEARSNVSGDRSATQEEHRSRAFKFVQPAYRNPRVVVVHLVRCELRRFVFAMHSNGLAALMNYITGTHAVSLFPRSAFIDRLSFVACQEMVPGADRRMSELHNWLHLYSPATRPIKIVAEPIHALQSLDGPAFDVLDWKMGVTRHGSYLRIGEPFVWRAWSHLRGGYSSKEFLSSSDV